MLYRRLYRSMSYGFGRWYVHRTSHLLDPGCWLSRSACVHVGRPSVGSDVSGDCQEIFRSRPTMKLLYAVTYWAATRFGNIYMPTSTRGPLAFAYHIIKGGMPMLRPEAAQRRPWDGNQRHRFGKSSVADVDLWCTWCSLAQLNHSESDLYWFIFISIRSLPVLTAVWVLKMQTRSATLCPTVQVHWAPHNKTITSVVPLTQERSNLLEFGNWLRLEQFQGMLFLQLLDRMLCFWQNGILSELIAARCPARGSPRGCERHCTGIIACVLLLVYSRIGDTESTVFPEISWATSWCCDVFFAFSPRRVGQPIRI